MDNKMNNAETDKQVNVFISLSVNVPNTHCYFTMLLNTQSNGPILLSLQLEVKGAAKLY